MKVSASEIREGGGARSERAQAADGAAFEAALASEDVKLRKGETLEPVEGHAYAEIVSGKREGMYVNTSGNARHGEAFVLVRKGVALHERRRYRDALPHFEAALELLEVDEIAYVAETHIHNDYVTGGLELAPHYPGYPELANALLFCCTEMNTRQQIDALVSGLEELGGRS